MIFFLIFSIVLLIAKKQGLGIWTHRKAWMLIETTKYGPVTLTVKERAMVKCFRWEERAGPAFLNTGDDKVVQGESPPPRVILRQQVVHECGAESVSHLGQRLQMPANFLEFLTVLGIRDILVRFRIRGSIPMTNGS